MLVKIQLLKPNGKNLDDDWQMVKQKNSWKKNQNFDFELRSRSGGNKDAYPPKKARTYFVPSRIVEAHY